VDVSKDQSYFLHRLTQLQLARVLFPVGGLQKTEVRRIAAEIGLPNAKKKDSTGICFIGERPFRAFLNQYLSATPGPICTPEGQQVGEHMGLSFYTLGQRKGLGIGGVRRKGFTSSEGQGWFVLRKDVPNNVLYVAQEHDHPWLMSGRLRTLDACWVSGEPPPADSELAAKTRYRQADARARFSQWTCNPTHNRTLEVAMAASVASAKSAQKTPDAEIAGGFSLEFDAPQWAVTPGQSAVLYQGEVCLGGGIIADWLCSD
jgi:tRNA-specific 2-thiouridylase